jgi:hypothetical protein
MKWLAAKAMVVAVGVGVAIFALSGAAEASHVTVKVTTTPEQATVGRPAAVQISLRSAHGGLPVANTPVIFYEQESFGRVTGDVELGRAVTNQDGVAVLGYQPRSPGDHQIRVEYVTPGESQPEVASSSISVAAGASQLYRSTAGIHVPGLGAWLVIALVTLVWAILFSVALRVLAIARAGTDAGTVTEPALRPVEAERPAATQRAGTSEA